MKAETEKLIYDLRNLVSLQNITHQEILQKIDSILLCEANETKIGKLNLYDFTSHSRVPIKKDVQPAYRAVYHIGGYKYATDGHILIKARSSYKEDLEGKGVLKDGTILSDEYRPPKYESILKNIQQMNESWCKFKPYTIDISKIFEWENEHKIHMKTYGKCAKSFVILPNGYVVYYETLLPISKAMNQYGITQMYIHDDIDHLLYAYNDRCELALAPARGHASNIKQEDIIKVFHL